MTPRLPLALALRLRSIALLAALRGAPALPESAFQRWLRKLIA